MAVKGYVVRKGARWYAVIYEGVDPLTGRERRRWHTAGTDRAEAQQLATRLATSASATGRQPGLTLATFLVRQWLPAKQVNLRPSTWDSYRPSSSSWKPPLGLEHDGRTRVA